MEEQVQSTNTVQQKKNSAGFYILVFLILVIGYLVFGYFYKNTPAQTVQKPNSAQSSAIVLSDYFSYSGQTGKNALQLLREKAPVEQDATGLVSSINGRKANKDSHEYWAFYVNGKLAQVGPADYLTKTGEKIEWKIDKY